MSVAMLGPWPAVLLLVGAGCGTVRPWRENAARHRLEEQSYGPAAPSCGEAACRVGRRRTRPWAARLNLVRVAEDAPCMVRLDYASQTSLTHGQPLLTKMGWNNSVWQSSDACLEHKCESEEECRPDDGSAKDVGLELHVILHAGALIRQSKHVTTQTLQVVAEQFGLSPEEQRMLSTSRPGHGLLLVGPWRIHLDGIASTAEERVAMTAPRERQALATASAAEEEEEVEA
jgi:hypothetical protein